MNLNTGIFLCYLPVVLHQRIHEHESCTYYLLFSIINFKMKNDTKKYLYMLSFFRKDMYIFCNHIIMNYLTAKVLLCVCVGGGGVYTNTTESLILKIIWLYRYAFGIRLVFFPQDQCYFIELRCKKKIWIYINKLYNQYSTTFWFTFNSVTHYNEC